MRKIKLAVSWLLLLVIALSASGCYVVNPQYKWRVKGTYRLTTYTYTRGACNSPVETINYL